MTVSTVRAGKKQNRLGKGEVAIRSKCSHKEQVWPSESPWQRARADICGRSAEAQPRRSRWHSESGNVEGNH